MENEIAAYELFDNNHRLFPEERKISSKCLGHLTKNGRIIGVLLEKKKGAHASLDDLATCEATLRQIHKIGLVHGNVSRYNFRFDKAHVWWS